MIPFLLPCFVAQRLLPSQAGGLCRDHQIIVTQSTNPRKKKKKKQQRNKRKPLKKLIVVHPKVKQQQQQQQQLDPRLRTLVRILRTYMSTVCLLPQFQYLAAAGPDRCVSPLWQTPPKAKQSKAKQCNSTQRNATQAHKQTSTRKTDLRALISFQPALCPKSPFLTTPVWHALF
jgi:cell division protein FtsN